MVLGSREQQGGPAPHCLLMVYRYTTASSYDEASVVYWTLSAGYSSPFFIVVGRCMLILSKPVLKAPPGSALEATIG